MDNFPGQRIGKYEILEFLSQTEIVSIFKAHDTILDRVVILKLMIHSNNYAPEFRAYFLQEARKLAQLSHPNIVSVLDYGQEEDYIYLVMEYRPGKTLEDLMVNRSFTWQETVDLLIPIIKALAYAHQTNAIHRDLNPSKIIIDDTGHPVIIDFSIARLIEEEETRELSGTNVGLGTPSYMSPEQGRGMPVDFRADIYSLGIIFYEMVTGRKPFDAENGIEVVIQQVTAPITPPRKLKPDLPKAIENIIMNALKKDPDERYQVMEELLEDLEPLRKESDQSLKQIYHRMIRKRILTFSLTGIGLILVAFIGFTYLPGFFQNYRLNLTASRNANIVATTSVTTNTETVTQTPTQWNMPTVSITPKPSQTSTTTSTPTQTPLAMMFPEIPAIPGKNIVDVVGSITRENVQSLVEIARYGNPAINQFSWAMDNQILITATSLGVYVYDTVDLSIKGFIDYSGWLTAINVYSTDDLLLIATGDKNGTIRIFDGLTNKEIYVLDGHTQEVFSLAFSNDGSKLVSGSKDKTVKVWDLSNGQELFNFTKHYLSVRSVLFSHDDKYVFSGSEDFMIYKWDLETGSILSSYLCNSLVISLSINQSDTLLAAGLWNSRIQILNVSGDITLQSTLSDTNLVTGVTSVSLSPKGDIVASGSEDGELRIWNVNNGLILWEQDSKKTNNAILQVLFSQGNATKVSALYSDGTISIWDMTTRETLVTSTMSQAFPGQMIFSRDAHYLIVQKPDATIEFWSLSPNLLEFENTSVTIPYGYPISEDNQYIALAHIDNKVTDGQIFIYPLGSTEVVNTLYDYPSNGYIRFLQAGNLLGAASSRRIQLWSLSSSQILNNSSYKNEQNCQVAYMSDGTFQAAGSNMGIFTSDVNYSSLCKVSKASRLTSYTFTEDNTYIGMGYEYGSIEVWDATNSEMITLKADTAKSRIICLSISPSDSLIAAGDINGDLFIYDLATQQLLFYSDSHRASINEINFSPEGQYLATSSSDGTLRIWGVP